MGCGWAFWTMMLAHPCVVRLLSSRVTDSIDALEVAMEGVLAPLGTVGLTGADAVRAYDVRITYALGFSGYQAPRSWSSDPEAQRQRRHFYAGLPAGRFPTTVRLSSELPMLASVSQFEFGLRLIAEGVAARTSSPPTR